MAINEKRNRIKRQFLLWVGAIVLLFCIQLLADSYLAGLDRQIDKVRACIGGEHFAAAVCSERLF